MTTHITILGIICNKTKEAVDEVYLKFFVDDKQEEGWGIQSMDDGDTRSISRNFTFDDNFRAELWEDDRLKHDDHIGDMSIEDDPTIHGQRTCDIKGHRAEYAIVYLQNPLADKRYWLHLNSLRCDDAQEREDEPYLIVNTRTVWGPGSMRSGYSEDLSRVPRIAFSEGGHTARVELWERDGSRSDRFGVLDIDQNQAQAWASLPQRDRLVQHTFHRDKGIVGDATYRLFFYVTREEIPPGPDPDRG